MATKLNRSKDNPWKLKTGLRGRFGVYVPPLMEELGLCELEHNAKNNRIRAPGAGTRLGRDRDAAGLPLEPPDREHRGERRAELEDQNRQRLSGRGGEPLDGEERHDRDLSRHEELPDVGSGSLVGLTGRAERRGVANHGGEGGDRHHDWNKGTRPLEQCAVHQNLRHQPKSHM